MRSKRWQIAISLLFSLVILTTVARGAAPPVSELQAQIQEEKQAPKVAPEAEKVLRQLSGYYTKLESASLQMVTSVHQEVAGQKKTAEVTREVDMKRPNMLSVKASSGDQTTTLSCDGEKVYTYLSSQQAYSVSDAPKSLGALAQSNDPVARQITSVGQVPGGMNLLWLFSKNPSQNLVRGAKEVRHAGVEEEKGEKFDHLRIVRDRIDWDVWVARSDEPRIHRISPDMTRLVEQIKQQLQQARPDQEVDIKLDINIQFQKWQPNAKLEKEAFSFSPPSGAQEVESWMEFMRARMEEQQKKAQEAQSQRSQKDPRDMVGKAAPDFTLEKLGGGEVKLSSHESKDIVVLDFWASWCGPCQRLMPIMEKISEDYADKDVAFYAVNVGESAEKARTFLENQELDLLVLLDTELSVAQEYGVTGIPQTVLVGKDGVVEAVHRGVGQDTEKQLKSELDALLAGESLSEQEQGEQKQQ